MPKISDLRAIAERRTKGEWGSFVQDLFVKAQTPSGEDPLLASRYDDGWFKEPNDAEFCATAANTYDQLLRIAEAAQNCVASFTQHGWAEPSFGELMMALKQLEGE